MRDSRLTQAVPHSPVVYPDPTKVGFVLSQEIFNLQTGADQQCDVCEQSVNRPVVQCRHPHAWPHQLPRRFLSVHVRYPHTLVSTVQSGPLRPVASLSHASVPAAVCWPHFPIAIQVAINFKIRNSKRRSMHPYLLGSFEIAKLAFLGFQLARFASPLINRMGKP